MSGLQSFLDQGQGADVDTDVEPAGQAAPPEPPKYEEVKDEAPRPEPEPEPKPEGEPEPQGQQPPQQQPEREDARRVPLAALEAERRARQKHQDEAAELRRQLEAFQRGQAQPPASQRELTDEEKFFERVQETARQAAQQQQIQDRFYQSEVAAVRKYGAEAVKAAADQFLAVREFAPQVQVELNRQPDPIGWLVEQSRHVSEVGEFVRDGAAYRAKIEAEMREKLRAEMAGQGPGAPAAAPRAPTVRTQPSIAGARSVSGRDAVDESDTPLGDLLRR